MCQEKKKRKKKKKDKLRAILSVNRTGYCLLKQLLSNEKLEQRNGKVRKKVESYLILFLLNSDSGLKKTKQQKGKNKQTQKAPTQQICSTTTTH